MISGTIISNLDENSKKCFSLITRGTIVFQAFSSVSGVDLVMASLISAEAPKKEQKFHEIAIIFNG